MRRQPRVRFDWIVQVLMSLAVLSRSAAGAATATALDGEGDLRLVLWITVDQLRGDMPARSMQRFGEGGFTLLARRGVWFDNAHYRHACTVTGAGHATLFTGGNPPEHGIVGNQWHDVETGRTINCVGDDRHAVIGRSLRPGSGRSPLNLKGSTVGDELILATAGRAKVFGVSRKDRGAILPAGHYGKAFWYDGSSGGFTSSTYYYQHLPEWVVQWNAGRPADRYAGTSWELLDDLETYRNRDHDDRRFERSHGEFGRTFPHPLPNDLDEVYALLTLTPMSDELTAEFAMELMVQEQLGVDEVCDLLAVSFSATDAIGHAFGPESLEAEDNLRRLDRTLARLLTFVDETVGLEQTLVVLSSDHGVGAVPELRHSLTCGDKRGHPDWTERREGDAMLALASGAGEEEDLCCTAGRHFPSEFLTRVNARLRKRFGFDRDVVAAYQSPNLYLDESLIESQGLELEEVEREAARALEAVPGMAAAFTRTDVLKVRLPDSPLARRVARSVHPERSGNVILVPEPFWYLGNGPHGSAATHGTPYSYDTHVPIFIMAPGVPAAGVSRRVGPEDIAATVARWLSTVPPSGCVGEPLEEALPARMGLPR